MSKEKNRCLDKETGQTRKSENDPGKNMKFGFIQNDIWIWWFQAHKYPLDHFKEETQLENRKKNLGFLVNLWWSAVILCWLLSISKKLKD